MFTGFEKALKPGGILGLVEHRAKAGTPLEKQIKSGYMTEDYVVQMAKDAGFMLDAKSEINANPRDTADHPKGVWNLLPGLRGVADDDKANIISIGESDRMTLRFIKE
jgi:predicted methyltransferase